MSLLSVLKDMRLRWRPRQRFLQQNAGANPGASMASPWDGCSNPAMILSIVDLPALLGPTTPIFAPVQDQRDIIEDQLIAARHPHAVHLVDPLHRSSLVVK